MEENSSKNDTQFWNNWKQFSEDRSKNNIEIKDGNKWENYYQNLHSETQMKSLPPADIKEPNQILNRRITEKEFKIVIKKLKKKKAVGFDNLSNEMFKNIPDKFLGMLLVIYNMILEKGQIPEIWCKGLITPIHKKGDKLNQITIGVFVLQMLYLKSSV